MVYAFDTLGFSKRLRDAGVPPSQAEAHAEAARDFIMTELVTKNDLLALRADLANLAARFDADLSNATGRFDADLKNAVTLLQDRIEAQTLRLTVRLGAMLAAAIAILAAIQKLA